MRAMHLPFAHADAHPRYICAHSAAPPLPAPRSLGRSAALSVPAAAHLQQLDARQTVAALCFYCSHWEGTMAGSIAVVGIDIGTQSVVIAQARRGAVDVILNESSKRLTP